MADRHEPPLRVFRFLVAFEEVVLGTKPEQRRGTVPLCDGAFSECSGLEATMEPKVIREGGRNYGAVQRAGPVTFGTVVLKRGMTRNRDAWRWFELVTHGSAYAYRLAATITLLDMDGSPVLAWRLERALPVKFKAADLNAKSSDVGIEELHLAHEGLRAIPAGGQAAR
jgi:phage tail-like protein